MSIAVFDSNSLDGLAQRFGASPQQLTRNRIDLANARPTAERLVGYYARRDAENGVTRTDEQRFDDITTFLGSVLSVTLAPSADRLSNRRYLLAPGYASPSIIPVAARARPMTDFIRWEAYTDGGEAVAFPAGDVSGLRYVGQSNDMAQQPLMWYGCAVKANNPFEQMREAITGQSKFARDTATAGRVMADYAEQVGCWGVASAKVPGLFTTGASMSLTMEYDPGAPAITAEQLHAVLMRVHEFWYRANPNTVGPRGCILPRRWWANWVGLFFGDNKEGVDALAKFRADFPWLANAIVDDRLASGQAKAFMQLYGGGDGELYFEAMPPMVLGPYPMGLDDVFYYVAQTGGVVNENKRQLLRAVAP